MSNIVAGDNGTELEITVMDDIGVVDLTSVNSIAAHFIRGDKSTLDKPLAVTDAQAGTCKAVLTAEDISVPGAYTFQVTATFSNGNVFASDQQQFFVNRKL